MPLPHSCHQTQCQSRSRSRSLRWVSWHRDDFAGSGFDSGAAQLEERDVSMAVAFLLAGYAISGFWCQRFAYMAHRKGQQPKLLNSPERQQLIGNLPIVVTRVKEFRLAPRIARNLLKSLKQPGGCIISQGAIAIHRMLGRGLVVFKSCSSHALPADIELQMSKSRGWQHNVPYWSSVVLEETGKRIQGSM